MSRQSISKNDVDAYDLLLPMLQSAYEEVRELSKKKQDDALNQAKVTIINRILQKIKVLLGKEPTVEFLDLLDDSSLPTNSDATLILAQYKSAMQVFREKYYNVYSGGWIINSKT